MIENQYSSKLPDITNKRTLDLINTAINCSERWEHAIDIGGGCGHYSIPLLHKFHKVTLVEPSNAKEHVFLKSKYSNLSVVNKMIEDFEIKEFADFILLADLFEHIKEIEPFTKKISSMQNKGGVVFIITPNPLFCGPATESEIHFSKVGRFGHVRHYFFHEVDEIMNKVGYKLLFYKYEETPTRKKVRRFIKALSRRDKKFSKFILYKLIVGPVLRFLLILPIFKFLEYYVYNLEKKSSDNIEITYSTVYAYKKIKNGQ